MTRIASSHDIRQVQAPGRVVLSVRLSSFGWFPEPPLGAVRGQNIIINSKRPLDWPNAHVLELWLMDTGLVLEKLVGGCSGMLASYIGPPDSTSAKPGAPAAGNGSLGIR